MCQDTHSYVVRRSHNSSIRRFDQVLGIGNGYCDRDLNNEDCLYDGGDCCECTCEYDWDDDYACSADGSGFDCKDPSAPCIGEDLTGDDAYSTTDNDYTTDEGISYDFTTWQDDDSGALSYEFIPSGLEQDGVPDEVAQQQEEVPLPTVDNAVEVGTKTEVSVTATAYDTRPGGESGCGEAGGDGCAPQNTRDGISSDIESRWSCASKLVEGEGPCQIEYTFAEPQDIVDIQVAFWNGNERIRTLKVGLEEQEMYFVSSTTHVCIWKVFVADVQMMQ